MLGKIIIFSFFLLISLPVSCQSNSVPLANSNQNCSFSYGQEATGSHWSNYPNGVLSGGVSDIGGDTLLVSFMNRSKDTLYILNSYLPKSYQSASCLHRVDVENAKYIISFLPLLPFLGTRSDDRVLISSERVCSPFQIKYNFIKLAPDSYFNFTLDSKAIAKVSSTRDYVYMDIDPKQLSKFGHGVPFVSISKRDVSICLDSKLERIL